MKKFMCANWKMHKTVAEATAYAAELAKLLDGKLGDDREVGVFAPFTCLGPTAQAFAAASGIGAGAQNIYHESHGAFTGEISPAMVKDVGATLALAGHSERRAIFGESDEMVGKKVAFGLEQGLSMILCVGETFEERKAGKVEAVLARQLRTGLATVPADVAPERLSVAYEPVWAIGTGLTATEKEIVPAHTYLRDLLIDIFGSDAARQMRLLYGGSVKPDNTTAIMSLDNVDGVLVGGASLQAASFAAIALG